MDIANVSKRDEQCCLQMLDTLKVLISPQGLHVGDMVKATEAVLWFQDLAKKMGEALKASSLKAAPIIPQPVETQMVKEEVKPVTSISSKSKK